MSLIFCDDILETKFQKNMHNKLIRLGRLYIIETLFAAIIYLAVYIYQVVACIGNRVKNIEYSDGTLLFTALIFLHYFLAKKYLVLAKSFTII